MTYPMIANCNHGKVWTICSKCNPPAPLANSEFDNQQHRERLDIHAEQIAELQKELANAYLLIGRLQGRLDILEMRVDEHVERTSEQLTDLQVGQGVIESKVGLTVPWEDREGASTRKDEGGSLATEQTPSPTYDDGLQRKRVVYVHHHTYDPLWVIESEEEL